MITVSTIIIISTIFLISACLIALYHSWITRKLSKSKKPYSLLRHRQNPIISPLPHREWEANGTFNPAAVEDDEGKVHLLYRAIGADGVSQIGHAASRDGKHFHDRSSFPVFQPSAGNGLPDSSRAENPPSYDPVAHLSGGGWAGCEDPRTVKIKERVYMTYTAFEGWDSVRIGLTSISMADLKKHKWKWRKPIMISPAKQVAKNWVIFPGKIRGQYAILHSIVPKISIEYVDSLDMITKPIESPRLFGPQPGRKNFWDNRIRGAGAPPIKTDRGWLLLYHAMDKLHPHIGYKLGAMILDLNDPTKILYRSPQPILSPDMPYENDGKPGVIYASGAIIREGNLFVYYGGGDKHVCVAETPLAPLLDWLVTYGKP